MRRRRNSSNERKQRVRSEPHIRPSCNFLGANYMLTRPVASRLALRFPIRTTNISAVCLLGMKWRYLPNGFVLLLCRCSAFRSVSQMALSSRSGSFQVAAGLRSPNGSLNQASGVWLSNTLRRDCVRIRGGWGDGWRRVMKSRNRGRRSPLALKLRSDDEAKIRGGALPSKAAHTNSLDRFSGPIKLQVSRNWMCFVMFPPSLSQVCWFTELCILLDNLSPLFVSSKY